MIMGIQASYQFLVFLVLLCSVSGNNYYPTCNESPPFNCNITTAFNRSSFGNDFIFGVATSSYQVEGVEGRTFNVWDTFTHRWPAKTADETNGDKACGSLKLYKEDVAMLKTMGVDGYRLSISWSRILPRGRLSGGVNEDGIEYYNNLLNELNNSNIKPFVTLFHWDLPQILQDEYGGFLSPRIVNDFKDYADLCFQRFGDRVKHWITLNQPFTVSQKGFTDGTNAPGRCTGCPDGGDSGTEPYLTTHHQLLAHATTVDLYRKKYQKHQKGKIGTTLIARWFKPWNNTKKNRDAAERAFEFMFGWFMEPLTRGDYPHIMKKLVGSRLPKFSPTQSKLLKGSLDFLGLNYYVTEYTIDASDPPPDPKNPSYDTDKRFKTTWFAPNGTPIGVPSVSFYYYPRGLQELLTHIKEKYNNPLTYITENGFSDNGTLSLADTLADYGRIDCHCSHLCHLKSAIKNGSNVAGYFAWSLMDNYEFGLGFTVRFGMNYVNFSDYSDRQPKKSALWYTDFVKKEQSLDTLSTTSLNDMVLAM